MNPAIQFSFLQFFQLHPRIIQATAATAAGAGVILMRNRSQARLLSNQCYTYVKSTDSETTSQWTEAAVQYRYNNPLMLLPNYLYNTITNMDNETAAKWNEAACGA
eukprot:Pgem_evm1s8449